MKNIVLTFIMCGFILSSSDMCFATEEKNWQKYACVGAVVTAVLYALGWYFSKCSIPGYLDSSHIPGNPQAYRYSHLQEESFSMLPPERQQAIKDFATHMKKEFRKDFDERMEPIERKYNNVSQN